MFSKQQSSAWWKAKPREGRCDRPRECGPSVVYSDDASGPTVTRVSRRGTRTGEESGGSGAGGQSESRGGPAGVFALPPGRV